MIPQEGVVAESEELAEITETEVLETVDVIIATEILDDIVEFINDTTVRIPPCKPTG